jgi:hypothetical protein
MEKINMKPCYSGKSKGKAKMEDVEALKSWVSNCKPSSNSF